MAARSSKPGDLIIWAEKVIESCETPLQEITAKKVVRLVEKKLVELKYPTALCWAVHRSLREKLENKHYTRIHANSN